MSEIDISIVLTAHSEGLLAGVAAQNALACAEAAAAEGISCETVVVLDRATSLTAMVLAGAIGNRARFVETDAGDPGAARNAGIAAARGLHATFLDGDDLWSLNWLVAAHALALARPDAILHSACNLVFGVKRMVFWHVDSETALFDPQYLDWLNYWDAMTFARTETYRRYPFRENDLKLGFGHEDWHWNALTVAEGIAHKPVPRTMHFKRARPGSQMSRVDGIGGIRWPLPYRDLAKTRATNPG